MSWRWTKEFREFAVKVNLVDLAVGVIIGAAFGKIVSSFVADLVMPLIGILIGGIHYEDLYVEVGNAKIMYGKFFENLLDFVVIAFVIFWMVKAINHFRRKDEPAAAPPPADVKLLEEIRDLLKNRTKS